MFLQYANTHYNSFFSHVCHWKAKIPGSKLGIQPKISFAYWHQRPILKSVFGLVKVAYCFYITLGECSATRRVCVELFRHTYDRLLCGHIWTWWWTTSSVFAAGSCAIKHLRAVPLSCPLRFVVQEPPPAGACIMLCCGVGWHACSFGQWSLDSLCVSVLCIACLLCDDTTIK